MVPLIPVSIGFMNMAMGFISMGCSKGNFQPCVALPDACMSCSGVGGAGGNLVVVVFGSAAVSSSSSLT
eukprot:12926220-Prorocentrum_lima.AAC.1